MKWIKRMIKLTLFSAIAGIVSSAATLYAVQWYVEEQVSHWNVEWSGQSLKLGDLLSSMAEQFNPMDSTATKKWVDATREQRSVAEDDITDEEGNGEEQVAPSSEDAVAVFGGQSIQEMQQQDSEILFSMEEFEEAKDKMSQEDKMKIFSLLITRLPQEELQSLSTYIENGITEEELKEIKQIVSEYLEEEEYQQLIEMIKKY